MSTSMRPRSCLTTKYCDESDISLYNSRSKDGMCVLSHTAEVARPRQATGNDVADKSTHLVFVTTEALHNLICFV